MRYACSMHAGRRQSVTIKAKILAAMTAFGAVCMVNGAPASAIEPGVFTQCVAWNNGVTYAILNAGY